MVENEPHPISEYNVCMMQIFIVLLKSRFVNLFIPATINYLMEFLNNKPWNIILCFLAKKTLVVLLPLFYIFKLP